MGNKYLNAYIETQKPQKQLKDDAAQMFRSLGGLIYETPAGFQILGGTYGISMSFTAILTANVTIHQIKENKYELEVNLNWVWSTFMWVMLVLGILTGGISLLLLLMYFFFDPAPAYNQVLYRVVNYEN
jgi:predicted neutral ceramidase superfamily lipid hydrolase